VRPALLTDEAVRAAAPVLAERFPQTGMCAARDVLAAANRSLATEGRAALVEQVARALAEAEFKSWPAQAEAVVTALVGPEDPS
jgi:hypothetical protein